MKSVQYRLANRVKSRGLLNLFSDSCVHRACRRRIVPARSQAQGPSGRRKKPEWVSILEDDIDKDPDVAELLQGTDGDPDKIREKMRQKLLEGEMGTRQGIDKLPTVMFRELNYFRCWIWMEFYAPLGQQDLDLLDALIRSWFVIGKLGGFNSQNMQVSMNAEDDQSYFKYDLAEAQDSLGSFFHDMGQLESKQSMLRFWVDLGTCDELAIDVLLNMLFGFSKEQIGIKTIYVGGDNAAWPAPEVKNDMADVDFSSFARLVDEDEEVDESQDDDLDKDMKQSLGLR